jgi:pimeloyl-ACP methyl ester carboxylesterase
LNARTSGWWCLLLLLFHAGVGANPPAPADDAPPAAAEVRAEPAGGDDRPAADAAATGAASKVGAAAEGGAGPDCSVVPVPFVVDGQTVELAGQPQPVDVYRPVAAVPERVAIVAHGFARSRVRHRDLGQALAAAGITAVVPDLPHVVDQAGNGDAVVELVHRLDAGALGLPPLDRAHLVLVGTSAGGLATLLAAEQLPGLAGWIGLDPVDGTGMGEVAAGRLAMPAVVLLAPAAGCNLFGSGRAIARAIPGLRRSPLIDDASHCDFEGPTNRFCETLCGKSSGDKRARIRDETVAAALELLGACTGRR